MADADTPLGFDASDRFVLVASTGGHLEQLFRWARRWGVTPDRAHWVTFANEQSLSLLEGWNVTYVDYVRPRDWRGTVRAVSPIVKAIKDADVSQVVSTGAAVAVSAAIASWRTRSRFTYIESLARVDRLSATARILQRVPRIRRYVQSPQLVSSRFAYAGSILDDFSVEEVLQRSTDDSLRVLVTVGTIKPYRFDRLLQALDPITEGDSVVWQIGESTYAPSHGTVHKSMDRGQLIEELKAADVVVSHAGVGSILASLGEGRIPLVAARSVVHGEHIDDHQQDIVRMLSAAGLVVPAEIGDLTREHLLRTTAFTSTLRTEA